MHEIFLNLTAWITAHPNLAGLTIFSTSFLESLAFIGLIMPGAALMLTAGALIATGALSFWPTMAWAVCGAILADGLSFWIGHHYKQNIRSFFLFARHPDLLDKGEIFFHHHGGKSVFFGRFVGPIRPIIPIVAGMVGMSQGRFTINNILSALVWAPTYLLPGMAFGISLALAGEVAGRLAFLLIILMLLCWLISSVFRRLFLFILTYGSTWEEKFVTCIHRSPILQRWLSGFFDKDSFLLRPIVLMFCLMIGACWLFLGVTEDVLTGDPLVRSGHSLYHLLQGFRTPWSDTVVVGITMLGDAAVTIPFVLAALFWLLLKKEYYSSLLLTTTTGVSFLLVTVVKNLTKISRPVDIYGGTVHWAFPSSHATMSLVIFGFMALLCSRELVAKRRWLPFALALFLILGIGFSRLYLGAHWLADVVGGFSLGTAWLIIMTMVFLHGQHPCKSKGLFSFSVVVFLLAAAVHWTTNFETNQMRYQQQHPVIQMTNKNWLAQGWQNLPDHRIDLGGEEELALNLQYTGKLEQLQESLEQTGWKVPMLLTPASSLRWLMAAPGIDTLPILPQIHDGRHETLQLIHTIPDTDESFLALRFWPADVMLDNTRQLWLGSLSTMTVHHYLGLLHLPMAAGTVSPALLKQHVSSMATTLKSTGQESVLLIQENQGGQL